VTLPTAEDVVRAAAALPPELRHTPCVRSAWLSDVAGHEVWLKLESLQPTHSFKVRGAFTALAALLAAGGSPPRVVTASAGNHGAALGWAAARMGVPLVVFTPRDAPLAKRRRITRSGAELRLVAGTYDEAERAALAWARETGATFVSPYNDTRVIAGAGTLVLEALAQVPGLDEIVAPLGGGGLLAGILTALGHVEASGDRRPGDRLPGGVSTGEQGSGDFRKTEHGSAYAAVRAVGAEPDASPAFTTALAHGRITPIVVHETIADGLAGNIEPGSITYDIVAAGAPRVVRAREATIRRAVADLLEEEHLVAEGAAGAALAAVLDGLTHGDARRTVVVLSGSNRGSVGDAA
jgi:threonine dehydratase